jgi:hypothetical protein
MLLTFILLVSQIGPETLLSVDMSKEASPTELRPRTRAVRVAFWVMDGWDIKKPQKFVAELFSIHGIAIDTDFGF